MENLKVKILTEDGRINPPSYIGDAGYDVYSTLSIKLEPHDRISIPLGLALEFDSSHICLVQGKSGLAKKLGLDTIGNVIDSSYRGEIHTVVVNVSSDPIFIEKGMKIAQLIFVRVSTPEIKIVDNIASSERGLKCFGSSGR